MSTYLTMARIWVGPIQNIQDYMELPGPRCQDNSAWFSSPTQAELFFLARVAPRSAVFHKNGHQTIYGMFWDLSWEVR